MAAPKSSGKMAKNSMKGTTSSTPRAPRRRPKRESDSMDAEAELVSAESTVAEQTLEPEPPDPQQRASLAVWVYLCGDNHVRDATNKYLAKLLNSTPCSNIHLVIQYDTPDSAKRYIVRAGEKSTPASDEEVRRDVNTGDPKALEEFLKWGLTAVVAEHHVLIFSGLGINPRYVRQSLPLDALPEPLRKARGGKPRHAR